MPLTIYSEEADAATYVPAGWMGETKSIQLNPASTDQPHGGKVCLKCEFTGVKGWGGVVWQDPAGDWGDRAGGYDLTGAKKLTFWARGETGEEIVSFEFGTLDKAKKFTDTAKGALPKVKLGKDWQQYEIPVAGKDLTRIKSGFAWTVASTGQPVTFHLDEIRWE